MRLGTHCKFTLMPVDFVRSDLVEIMDQQFVPLIEDSSSSTSDYSTEIPNYGKSKYADANYPDANYPDNSYGNYDDSSYQ